MEQKGIYLTIMDRLSSDPYFSHFKWLKSKGELIEKFKWGWKRISTGRDVWGADEIKVWVVYGVRYNFLSNWFEQFHYADVKAQRQNATFSARGHDYHFHQDYCFKRDWSDFEEKYELLRNELVECSSYFFNLYNGLKAAFDVKVRPIIEEDIYPQYYYSREMMVFLGLCKIVAPNSLHILKEKLSKEMHRRYDTIRDPDIAPIIGRLDEIFTFLDNHDFDSEMKNVGLTIDSKPLLEE